MLANSDLGTRVVVRRRVGSKFTDLLGELTDLNSTDLTVLTKHGPVRVPLAEVHRAKRVPDITGLELAAAEAWPPLELVRLGDWQLRAADGYTSRANSALPLGDPGMALPDAIDAVVAFYAERGLPPRFEIPLPTCARVRRALVQAGWQELTRVRVLAIDLPELVAGTPASDEPSAPEFTLGRTPSASALAMIAAHRSKDGGPLPAAATHVLTAPPAVAFAEHAPGDVLLSLARGAVTRRWLGIFTVETAPQARRRGLARAALGVLARWGHEHGATRAYVQVWTGNEAALALYHGLGFTEHHIYTRFGVARF